MKQLITSKIDELDGQGAFDTITALSGEKLFGSNTEYATFTICFFLDLTKLSHRL